MRVKLNPDFINSLCQLPLSGKVFIKENSLLVNLFFLMNTLPEEGNWQSELIKSGFNYTLINSMVSK